MIRGALFCRCNYLLPVCDDSVLACSVLQCYLFWYLIVQLCLIVQSVSNLRGRLPRRIETEAGEVSTLGQMGSI